jgi:hypothetical protein
MDCVCWMWAIPGSCKSNTAIRNMNRTAAVWRIGSAVYGKKPLFSHLYCPRKSCEAQNLGEKALILPKVYPTIPLLPLGNSIFRIAATTFLLTRQKTDLPPLLWTAKLTDVDIDSKLLLGGRAYIVRCRLTTLPIMGGFNV